VLNALLSCAELQNEQTCYNFVRAIGVESCVIGSNMMICSNYSDPSARDIVDSDPSQALALPVIMKARDSAFTCISRTPQHCAIWRIPWKLPSSGVDCCRFDGLFVRFTLGSQ
jgi:hypothetical protein